MKLLRLIQSESGQGTFEYLIGTAFFAVALVTALLAFDSVVVQVVGHVCPSVDTSNPVVAVGSCLIP